jgi:hypothetical protein
MDTSKQKHLPMQVVASAKAARSTGFPIDAITALALQILLIEEPVKQMTWTGERLQLPPTQPKE